MFFIGLFGINGKMEPSGHLRVGRCPVCGCGQPLPVTHGYQNFSAFFVPVFRFHSQYFATCPGCASVFSVPTQYGAKAAENGICDVNAGALTLLQRGGERRCPACGAKIDAGDAFCRSCGYRL